MGVARAFSITRFTTWLFVLEGFSAVLWGVVLGYGIWGGYFHALPLIPIFFTVLGAVSVRFMRRGLQLKSRRGVTQVMLVVVARLMASLLFVLLGLLLLSEVHRTAFLLVTGFCYLLAFLLMARASLHP